VNTYSLRDAARILKVPPSRLRYWKRTALAHARGEDEDLRSRPGFDFRDLVCVRAMLTLVDRGVSVRRIRHSVEILQESVPDLDDPLAALRLWAEGSERVVVEHDGVLLEPDGQMVLDFGVSEAEAEGPALIADMLPLEEAPDAHSEAVDLFEQGCHLDTDPATHRQAVELYQRCIELNPEFGDAHCNLGAVLYNLGQSAEARSCFERCLKLDRRHVEANFNLANLLEEEGRDEVAMRHYRAALQADPFYADLHVNMALLYEKLRMPRKARDHWRRYMQLDPAGGWVEVARQRLAAEPGPEGP